MARENHWHARCRRFIVLAAFFLLACASLVLLRWAPLVYATARDVLALREMTRREAALAPTVRALLADARAWRNELAALFAAAPSFAGVPNYGGDFAQHPQLGILFERAAEAAEPSLTLYDAFETKRARGLGIGAAVLAVAQENAAQIQNARAALARVRAERAAIDPRALSPEAHWLLRSFDDALDEWDAALTLLERALVLLGADAPRRYVILAQNNDELRAAGGFISAVGIIKIERGEIGVEWFGDSYATDDLSIFHPPPPMPLQKYMWASQWLVRDANWYAHFPTSADVAQSMLARDRGVRTDGVLAVDMRLLPRLLVAVGEVELNRASLSPENALALVRANWQPLPPGEMSAAWFASDRKNFLAELFTALMTRIKTGDVKTAALAQALWNGLREKSVQVYLNDDVAEQAILNAGWGGAIETGEGDYLFVVDSNVGFNKVNARVTRALAYEVHLGEDENHAAVEITYDNPSRAAEGGCDLLKQHKDSTYASMTESCYWDYVRVLAPRGSALIAAQGVADAGLADDIDAVTAFGGYAIVPRAATQTVRFEYRLPKTIWNPERYSLRVQAQAGAAPAPLRVRVELPNGYTLHGSTDPFTRRDARTVEFRMTLMQDRTITLYLNPITKGIQK